METGPKLPLVHKESLRLSVATAASASDEISYHYFDAVSLGEQIPA